MKYLEVSDEDYEILTSLSKELQEQPNHYQAFPYFWEPRSKIEELDFNGEGEIVRVEFNGESYGLEDLFNDFEKLRIEFLEYYELSIESEFESIDEADYINWLVSDSEFRFRVLTFRLEHKTMHNPSLFLSDVQNFIKRNPHHLGQEPSTYARTIWRMPKMEKLVKAIYRLSQPISSNVNHEAEIYCVQKSNKDETQ